MKGLNTILIKLLKTIPYYSILEKMDSYQEIFIINAMEDHLLQQ